MSANATEQSGNRKRRWGIWVVAVFVLQGSLLYWVSDPTNPETERPRSNLALMPGADAAAVEALAQEDPEALSLPNAKGLSGIWMQPGALEHELHRWTAPDISVPFPSNLITAPLEAALASNAPPRGTAFVKPAPRLTVVEVPSVQLRKTNWLQIAGGLAGRKLERTAPVVSSRNHSALLRPSRVQVMVDSDGRVFTGALIDSCGLESADRLALEVALKKLRFAPATNELTTGDLVFYWHVNPNTVTNLTVNPLR